MSPLDPRDIALTSEEATRRFFSSLAGRVDRSIASPSFAGNVADEILAAFGSGVIAQTWDSSEILNATDWGSVLTDDERQNFTAIILREPALVTGVVHYCITAGVFTALSNNKVALYRPNEAFDGVELVAASAADPNLWKTAGFLIKPFTEPVALEAGLYYASHLYRASTVTTAPVLATRTTLNIGLVQPLTVGLGRNMSFVGASDAAASYTLAGGLVQAGGPRWAALY